MSLGREPNEPTFVGVPADRVLRQIEPPLTKRELIAAMAMQGLLANAAVDVESTKLAGMCLLQTDALLAKLEEKKEGKE